LEGWKDQRKINKNGKLTKMESWDSKKGKLTKNVSKLGRFFSKKRKREKRKKGKKEKRKKEKRKRGKEDGRNR